MGIEETIRSYIIENFMYASDDGRLTSELSLFDNGIIDSTGVLELVGFIEEKWGIHVEDTELVPDHFDSISKLSAFLRKKGVA
jgi:acyl carrier protein